MAGHRFALVVMKSLLKYLMFLCVLTAVGYTQSYAAVHKVADSILLPKYTTCSADVSARVKEHPHALILNSSSSPTEKKAYKIYIAETEVEEDEVPSSKKHACINYSTASILFSGTLAHLFSNRKSPTRNYDYFSYSSLDQYLIFRVFRI
jgi:hypothetical protein